MGKRGPAPKPTALKVLHGDKPQLEDEPIPSRGELVPPAYLDPPALEIWARLAPDLASKGVLTAWDVDAFGRFCWLTARGYELMSELVEDGLMAGKVKDPRNQVLRDMSTEMVTLAGRFGLTPVDRMRLAKPKEKSGTKGADLLTG